MHKTYNGGISLTIVTSGSPSSRVSIEAVTSYQPAWETVSESFTKADYSTHTIYMGDRFTASITTGIMTEAEMSVLRDALLTHEFTLMCPEYPETVGGGGVRVRLTSLSQPLEAANYGRKVYRITFAVAAVALVNNGSGL